MVKIQQEFVKVDVQHPIQTRRSSQASTRRTMYQYQSASISMPSRQVLFVYSPHDSPAEVFVTVITHSHSPADSSKQVPLRRTDCSIRGGIPQNNTVLVPPTRGLPSPMTRVAITLLDYSCNPERVSFRSLNSRIVTCFGPNHRYQRFCGSL
uniref:(northern house mosquito) hypothetical protein n=1 Tax=Culex pipiens TaxID=7175 RepID=A0A8D8FI71_CULPI